VKFKSKINYRWQHRGKRWSKYAHVYQSGGTRDKPWKAVKIGVFLKIFATEEEAGEYVRRQLKCTLAAMTYPDWTESMRRTKAESTIPCPPLPEPVEEKKPCLGKFKPRVLKVCLPNPVEREERVFSANELKTGWGEANPDGYDQTHTGAIW